MQYRDIVLSYPYSFDMNTNFCNKNGLKIQACIYTAKTNGIFGRWYQVISSVERTMFVVCIEKWPLAKCLKSLIACNVIINHCIQCNQYRKIYINIKTWYRNTVQSMYCFKKTYRLPCNCWLVYIALVLNFLHGEETKSILVARWWSLFVVSRVVFAITCQFGSWSCICGTQPDEWHATSIDVMTIYIVKISSNRLSTPTKYPINSRQNF